MTTTVHLTVYKKTSLGVMCLTGWGHQKRSDEALGTNLFALEAWERMTEGGLKVGFLYDGYALMTKDGWLWVGKSPFIW